MADAFETILQGTPSADSTIKHDLQHGERYCVSVAHDLRCGLRTISSIATKLIESAAERLELEDLDLLHRQLLCVERLSREHEGIRRLWLAGQAGVHCEWVDITALAMAIATELRPSATTSIEIEDGLTAWLDPALAAILLRNLLSNALLHSERFLKARIQIGQDSKADCTLIFVRDNGPGFGLAHGESMFEPNSRLDSEYVTSGFGLACAKRIVERHGGRIWAESEPGLGATFHISLPKPRLADIPPAEAQCSSIGKPQEGTRQIPGSTSDSVAFEPELEGSNQP